MIVEFFSAEIDVSVWRYRSWRAEGDSEMMSAASFSAREAFISPSAAMTWKKGYKQFRASYYLSLFPEMKQKDNVSKIKKNPTDND